MENTLPKILRDVAGKYPDINAQYTRKENGSFVPNTYKEMYEAVLDFGAGLLSFGIKRGDHVGLIADDRKEWQQSSMGIMAIGAADVPRGCDATEKDLSYILSFAGCTTVVAENEAQVRKILSIKTALPDVERIISFDPVSDAGILEARAQNLTVVLFSDIISAGKQYRINNPLSIEKEIDKGDPEEIACIIFTSGTTGEPKGVMLCHRNFTVQLDELPERITLSPGDKALCVLPVWHSFQRLCEYVILCQAGAMCYSKPIGSILLADFASLNPQLLPAVPRVFEAVYEGVNRAMRKTGGVKFMLFKFFVAVGVLQSKIDRVLFRKTAFFAKRVVILDWIMFIIPWLLLTPVKALGGVLVFKKIRAKLGNAFTGGVSGGGALPPAVDQFYWAVGINIVEGYGLTETAPVVSVRPMKKPVFGTVGKPIRGVEVKITGEKGEILPPGKKGTVMVRGGIVMKGYYKKDDLTAKAIDKDGWLDTGDLGMMTINGELVLRGRKKDTIVLRGGENVEPLPIEMRLKECRFIGQCVVVGQDERYLSALIVPAQEEVENFAKENSIAFSSYGELLSNPEIVKMFDTEIQNLVNSKSGFKIFEKVARFALLKKPFEVGVELSAKQEIMRYKLPELYAKEMKVLYK